ncbi:MAG: phosphoribosylglycinamide formyltransferase [Treponema sp.]|nr:phosphoribosylglycinamide formyltransferase [Treponema sp.]
MPKKPGYALNNIRIMALVSGGGSNLQALLDAEKNGALEGGNISIVVSDRPGVYALERAQAAGVPALTAAPDKTISGKLRRQELSDRILDLAETYRIGLIVLAGFLSILAGEIIQRYSGKIINLHPSLLPKFGGDGMYGERVHRAVLEAGEKESGCTVHLVDAGTDTGPILLQRRVPVQPDDTPGSLAVRIHKQEHIAIVEAVKIMVQKLS